MLTTLYSQAENADPRDPVYPANLSAALFEMGDYVGCMNAIHRSWKLLMEKQEMNAGLVVRLSTRLARALSNGARAGTLSRETLNRHENQIGKLHATAAEKLASVGSAGVEEEWGRAWSNWEVVRTEMEAYPEKGPACLSDLSRLPMFCKPL